MHDSISQVEKAPVSIKANVPKADAETMKKQIEAGGSNALFSISSLYGPLYRSWC